MGELWPAVRWLHVLAMAFSSAGSRCSPWRSSPSSAGAADRERLRAIARRFGYGTLVAIAVLLATGSAMASHLPLLTDGTLQLKLALVAVVAVLVVWHMGRPTMLAWWPPCSAVSLVIVWLGLTLAHGSS